MIFNSSVVFDLTLSSIALNSPLFSHPPNLCSKSILFHSINLRKLTFYALYFDSSLSNLSIHRSQFEQLLEKPISIQQVDCEPYFDKEITFQQNALCATVTYCRFTGIKSSSAGGAFFVKNEKETTTLFDHCTFDRCSTNDNGGAIFFEVLLLSELAGVLIISSSTFDNCMISNEKNASKVYGGAICCIGRNLNVINSTFQHIYINSQVGNCFGGAIYASVKNAENSFFFDTFKDCGILNQTGFSASSISPRSSNFVSRGGAIYISIFDLRNVNDKKVDLFSCEFIGGIAENGSSIYSEEPITLVINATRFSYATVNNVVYFAKGAQSSNIMNKLFIETIGILEINCVHFFYGEDKQLEFLNRNADSGRVYYDKKYEVDVFSNSNLQMIFVNYYGEFIDMPTYTYQPPSTTPIILTPSDSPTPSESPTSTPSESPLPTPTQTEYVQTPVPTTTPIQSPYPTPTSSITSDENNTSAVVAGEKNGLSTVALVFIIIGCILFLIGLIIAAFLLIRTQDGCYRNRCIGSDTYYGSKTTYF